MVPFVLALAAVFPLELHSNKPFVPVSVNGSKPQAFILDTGCRGNSILARECADRLGIARTGDEAGQVGAGSGAAVQLSTARDPLFLAALGETLSVGEPVVMTLGHVARLEGNPVDGLLGGDFLARHVVTIDYAKGTLEVHDAYEPPQGATVVPIALDTGWPVAPFTLTSGGKRFTGHAIVDTGVRFTIAVFRPFAEQHGLLGGDVALADAVVGYGVGGASRGDVARLDALALGDFSVGQPVAIFSRDTTGIFALDGPDGIVGGELLRRARTTFDYPHGRLVLEPYASPGPFEFDMSGLFLAAEPPAYTALKVLAVNPGTPAAAAGILVGDEIVAIDGRKLALDDARLRLKTPGVRRLDVRRDGKTRTIRLEARRLV